MELLYHVDDKDRVLGSIERDAAHKENALHRSGMIFLLNSNSKVLIQERSPAKLFGGLYDSSASFHITFGESYEQGSMRELFEETGIKAKLIPIGKFAHNDPPEHEIVAVYFCKSDMPVKLDKGEATGAVLMSSAEVDAIVEQGKTTPWLRDGWALFSRYATENNIFGKGKLRH